MEALQFAKFSSASDVWSYAVTLWEIFSLGEIPWKGLTPIEIRDCLVRGERLGCPERCPREMYHVIASCWEERPQDRPTFSSLYQKLQKVRHCIYIMYVHGETHFNQIHDANVLSLAAFLAS